jgi:hypothetical protein
VIDLGDTYVGTIQVKDATGALVNAGSVSVTVTLPDASTGTPTVTNGSTGNYSFNYPTTQAGLHQFTWTGTGANAFTSSDVFVVAAANPGFMISLDEARKGLGTAAANTAKDEDLRDFIAAATPIMEDIIGSILPKTRIETFDGGQPNIALMYPPVISVTSVIETVGSAWQRTLTAQPITGSSFDFYGYSVDLTTGIITRRASGLAMPFMQGLRNIQVTYISGRVLAPNEALAARRLVKHLWQSEQQNYAPAAASPEAIGLTPSGYAVPRVVLELCAASTRPQALA